MNELKTKITDKRPVVGSWLSIGHPAVAEIMAMLEFDFVLIDLEHTPISLDTTRHLIQAIESTDTETVPIVRVPENDPVWIQRTLDMGVRNVMVPKVNTEAEAERLVERVLYPPEGTRGIAGSRATGYGIDLEEYVTTVNEDILTIAQIETRAGIDNAAEIAATNGIDATFVGPADLSGALDQFGDQESQKFRDAVETIIDAADEVGVPTGTFSVGADQIHQHVEQGFDFIIAGKDAAHLADGCEGAKDAFYSAVNGRTTTDIATD